MADTERPSHAAARLLNALRADRYIARNFADEIYRLGSIINEQDRIAALAQAPVACRTCESDGIYADNGEGPMDCYACGKTAPVAWMRRTVTYKAVDGRFDGERIVSERKVFADDLPLFLAAPVAAKPARDTGISAAVDRGDLDTLVIDGMAAKPVGVEVQRLRECIGFFASVIKSGEQWSSACQHAYDMALSSSGRKVGES